MWLQSTFRFFFFLTVSICCFSCHTTAQYDKSKKYFLSDKERKAETFTVDQAHALIEQNLATDHDEETTKRSKKQLKELQEINETPLQKKKKAKKKKSGYLDLY